MTDGKYLMLNVLVGVSGSMNKTLMNLEDLETFLIGCIKDLDEKEKPTQLESAAVLMLESAMKAVHAAQTILKN